MALVHKYGVVGELSFWTAHNNLVEFGLSGSREQGPKQVSCRRSERCLCLEQRDAGGAREIVMLIIEDT